jgi:hypothetical protein
MNHQLSEVPYSASDSKHMQMGNKYARKPALKPELLVTMDQLKSFQSRQVLTSAPKSLPRNPQVSIKMSDELSHSFIKVRIAALQSL